MDCKQVKLSAHSIQRMFEREVSKKSVSYVIINGEIIAEYPNDTPYPSYMILGFVGEQPIHVVIAFDSKNKVCYIITAYIPDKTKWLPDYKTRKK
ncbi:DUF4258 domain-containing protein [candidate division KSB1 bacterium]|nr:DUF4258 domain-containing protein [candidate division KSB1 bacterium]